MIKKHAQHRKTRAFAGRWGQFVHQRFAPIAHFFRKVPAKVYGRVALGLGTGVVVFLLASFLWPRTVQFSFAGGNCIVNPTLLPGLAKTQPSESFTTSFSHKIAIGKLDLFAGKTCVEATQPPKAGQQTTRLSMASLPVAKHITIHTPEPPSAKLALKPDQPVATRGDLQFELSSADTVFTYQLEANAKHAECASTGANLTCKVEQLELAQSATYDFTVQRLFKNQPVDTALTFSARTVEAVQVADSTIKPGQTVYGTPTEITLVLSKPITSFKDFKLQHIGAGDLPVTTSLDGANLTMRFEQPLPRQALFELSLQQVSAPDQASLTAPYSLQFATSGGPKVTGISIGTSRVQPGPFTITFDSTVAPGQNLAEFIRIDAGGPVGATFALQGNRVVVTPNGLPRCKAFSVSLADGLKNEAGVTGGSAWKFNSRTVCQVTFGIGASVKGRGIGGYSFGSGPSKILFAGTLHGNEKSAANTLNSFIADLEANADRIPAHRTIIVIPVVNPDGYAANTRTNANNVDLNRNFAANSWKQSVTMPGGSVNPNGGGPAPHSEPESRALANYVSSVRPRLVMSYHAVAPLVAANEAGDSLGLAQGYGRQAGWPVYGNNGSGNFDYDTTGAFEDWLRDRLGIPGILVEQASYSGNEYARQKNAMWSLVQLP